MNNIKQFRVAKGITQEHLGTFCGVDKTTVCKWETDNSNPDINTLIKLSQYFHCSIDDLVISNLTESRNTT